LEAGRVRRPEYSHFRTKAGGEIDLILEGSFGCLPVEVKYGSNTRGAEVRAISFFDRLFPSPIPRWWLR